MSTHLEPDGVYILPQALGDMDYLILSAEQQGDAWRLVESHDTPGGSEAFRARASLPVEQRFVFEVSPSGELRQSSPPGEQRSSFTLTNLSLLGYLRDGRFVGPATD